MNAKVGTRDVCSLSKTAWPIRAMARAWSRLTILANPERSAPAASVNGLPVIAIADDVVASQSRHQAPGSARRAHARPGYSAECDHARCPA